VTRDEGRWVRVVLPTILLGPKSEARNLKFETNPKFEFKNLKICELSEGCPASFEPGYSEFEFVSRFGFRISSLQQAAARC
jgi:hypothetical protein